MVACCDPRVLHDGVERVAWAKPRYQLHSEKSSAPAQVGAFWLRQVRSGADSRSGYGLNIDSLQRR